MLKKCLWSWPTSFRRNYLSSSECSVQGKVFHCKLRQQGCSLPNGRSSIANSGTKVTVLLVMNKCGSFPLVSAALKFLEVIYESFYRDLTQRFLTIFSYYTGGAPSNQINFHYREYGERWHEMNEWEYEMVWTGGRLKMQYVGGMKFGKWENPERKKSRHCPTQLSPWRLRDLNPGPQ